MPKTNTTTKTTSATKTNTKTTTKKEEKTMKNSNATTAKKTAKTVKTAPIKAPTNYVEAVQYLYFLFDKVNEKWFSEEPVTKPTITVQSTVRAYGHITTSEVWSETEKGKKVYKHELNIGADYLNRPIAETVATLIHEMVHLYNIEHNVKDTSNNNVYHNKKFKAEAEKHGIVIEHRPTIGFSHTEPSEELKKWCKSERFKDFKVTRGQGIVMPKKPKGGNDDNDNGDNGETPKVPKKPKSNSIKWQCPKCKAIVRSTKAFTSAPICGECYDKLGEIVRFTSEL